MSTWLKLVAQMNIPSDGTPLFTGETHGMMNWMLVAVLSVCILLVTFKTSKRNHLDRD